MSSFGRVPYQGDEVTVRFFNGGTVEKGRQLSKAQVKIKNVKGNIEEKYCGGDMFLPALPQVIFHF